MAKKKAEIFVPYIVTTSWLGPPDRRKARLDYHVQHRWEINHGFPGLDHLSICSGYSKAEAEIVNDSPGRCLFIKDRTPKWKKHNLILERLYNCTQPRSVLFMDDDVVPRIPSVDEVKEGLADPVQLAKTWLDYPSLMCAPLVYFSPYGLRFSAYWKNEKRILTEAKSPVSGWAVMMRNDLGVLYTEEMTTDKKTGLIMDDFTFRISCQAMGRTVLQHNRAFFKTLQGVDKSADSKSALYKDREERNKARDVFMTKMKRMYPDYFASRRGKKRSNPSSESFRTGFMEGEQ